ncbi:MAG: hypothetical protein GY817_08985 [bacterium]|nr:hypothetical protein [bacterium]
MTVLILLSKTFIYGSYNPNYVKSDDITQTNYFYKSDGEKLKKSNVFENGSGNVGIGEASPSQALDIIGSLEIEETTSSTTGVIYKDGFHFLHNYGANNVFLGYFSGNFTMTGGDNTAVGRGTLFSNTTGTDNTALGYTALSLNTTGFNNAVLGSGALKSVSTGSNNTAIGFEAGVNLTTGDNNIIIGKSALATSATGSNQLNIGNLIYGDLSAGNIGIGITSPNQMLDVGGIIRSHDDTAGDEATDYIEMSHGGTNAYINWVSVEGGTNDRLDFRFDGSTKASITSGGNVGIGIINAISKLHVYENTNNVGTTAGLTVENDGSSGDALIQFLLTGTQRWVMGIDHNGSDEFRIADSTDLSSDTRFTISPSNRQVSIFGDLHVEDFFSLITIRDSDTTVNAGQWLGGLLFQISDPDLPGDGDLAIISVGHGGSDGSPDGEIVFSPGTNGILTDEMYINNTNVLIPSNNLGVRTSNASIDLAVGDSDTGINWISDGRLEFESNNTRVMAFDSSRNIVIGSHNIIGGAELSGLSEALIFSNSNAYATNKYLAAVWEDGSNNHQIGFEFDYYTGSGGTGTTHSRIYVISNAADHQAINGANAQRLIAFYSNGAASKSGGGTWALYLTKG